MQKLESFDNPAVEEKFVLYPQMEEALALNRLEGNFHYV